MIQLSDNFNIRRILRFTFPSILMMIFSSIYGMVDGFFISNFVGKTPFAAVNLIIPYIIMVGSLGTLFGTGGSALVAVLLGQGDKRRANEVFSFITYFTTGLAVLFSIVGCLTIEPVSRLLGATDDLMPYCVVYGRIGFLGMIAYTWQYLFQTFMITAERPRLGFFVTMAAGVTNMILDGLFMGVMGLGVDSAAIATVLGECVGGVIPLLYFKINKTTKIRLGRTHMDWKALTRSAFNGSSEFLSEISMSIVAMLYNIQLMRYAGEAGVAAYGVLMYANFIFVGVYFGYTMGIGPVIGYKYGAGDVAGLRDLLGKSLRLISIFMLILTSAAEVFAPILTSIFVGYDKGLLSMTVNAFRIYALSFIFMGYNTFGSGFFTDLNDGAVSALISTARSLVLPAASVMLLPLLMGLNGIWFSVVVAEGLSLVITIACFIANHKKYDLW
ncbi:MAG: MATE family efflux transporter [Eubacteriales bacterium]|nr:MATE family efflux transporter [Eubacteriales bacterium]